MELKDTSEGKNHSHELINNYKEETLVYPSQKLKVDPRFQFLRHFNVGLDVKKTVKISPPPVIQSSETENIKCPSTEAMMTQDASEVAESSMFVKNIDYVSPKVASKIKWGLNQFTFTYDKTVNSVTYFINDSKVGTFIIPKSYFEYNLHNIGLAVTDSNTNISVSTLDIYEGTMEKKIIDNLYSPFMSEYEKRARPIKEREENNCLVQKSNEIKSLKAKLAKQMTTLREKNTKMNWSKKIQCCRKKRESWNNKTNCCPL